MEAAEGMGTGGALLRLLWPHVGVPVAGSKREHNNEHSGES